MGDTGCKANRFPPHPPIHFPLLGGCQGFGVGGDCGDPPMSPPRRDLHPQQWGGAAHPFRPAFLMCLLHVFRVFLELYLKRAVSGWI